MTSVPETKIGGRIGTGLREKEFDLWAVHCVRHCQKWMRREQGLQYDARDGVVCESPCGRIVLTALSRLPGSSCTEPFEDFRSHALLFNVALNYLNIGGMNRRRA